MFTTEETKLKLAKFCMYQERSHHEVMTKLRSWGYDEEEARVYIPWLIEEDFLSESRFASALVRGKHNQKKWGRYKIMQALRKHEISDYIAREALAEIEPQYMETLEKLALQKWYSLGRRKDYDTRLKLYKYLFAKGYENELINEIIDPLF